MGMMGPNPPRMFNSPPIMPDTTGMQPHEKLKAGRDYEEACEAWKRSLREQEDDDFETLGRWSWDMALATSLTILLAIGGGLLWLWAIWDMFGVKGYIALAVAGIAVFELANFLRKKL